MLVKVFPYLIVFYVSNNFKKEKVNWGLCLAGQI